MEGLSLPSSQVTEEARRIVEAADSQGITLRVLGACAFRIHCPEFTDVYAQIDRPITDIDFAGYRNEASKLPELFVRLGYKPNQRVIGFFGRTRHIYYDATKRLQADIFLDRLEMCHVLDFKDRLNVDTPTIPVADLLLEKMQIVKINEKDLKDAIILIRAHDLGVHDNNILNAEYVGNLLANDWGFYHTVTTNLKKLLDYLPTVSALGPSDGEDVIKKVNQLLQNIDDTPKSMGWKMRARIGPSMKWYNEVEEVSR